MMINNRWMREDKIIAMDYTGNASFDMENNYSMEIFLEGGGMMRIVDGKSAEEFWDWAQEAQKDGLGDEGSEGGKSR